MDKVNIFTPSREEIHQCQDIEMNSYDSDQVLQLITEVDKPRAHMFCAACPSCEGNGKCIGYVLFQKVSLGISIIKIVVLLEYRRQGIGRLLLRGVIDFALANNIKLCWLNVEVSNSTALSLYKSEGFISTDLREDFYATGRHAYRMEKEI